LSAKIVASATSGVAPLVVNLAGSANGGASPYSYSWAFGDGATSTAQNPSHRYSSPGSYIAILTVSDSRSIKTSASVRITAKMAEKFSVSRWARRGKIK